MYFNNHYTYVPRHLGTKQSCSCTCSPFPPCSCFSFPWAEPCRSWVKASSETLRFPSHCKRRLSGYQTLYSQPQWQGSVLDYFTAISRDRCCWGMSELFVFNSLQLEDSHPKLAPSHYSSRSPIACQQALNWNPIISDNLHPVTAMSARE